VGRIGERGREEAGRILVDEAQHAEAQLFGRRTYELTVYPVVLGAGERLFGETGGQTPVRLVETRRVDDLAYLVYERVR